MEEQGGLIRELQADQAVAAGQLIVQGDMTIGGQRETSKPVPPEHRHNLPPRIANYVDRPEELEAIHQALCKHNEAGYINSAAAWGDGGQGKTVLAITYAWKYADQYPGGRFFLKCERTESLLGQIVELSAKLGIPSGEDDLQTALLVKSHLETGPVSLLVLDNVSGLDQWKNQDFCSLLPGGCCKRLVTARADNLPIEKVRVGRLSHDQARDLLIKFRPDAAEEANAGAVQEIVRLLDGVAVAVAAVGSYMMIRSSVKWTNYAKSLRERPIEEVLNVDEGANAQLGGYPYYVYAVLDDAFFALGEAEQRTLEYASLLPEDVVPGPWLTRLISQDNEAGTVCVQRLPGLEDNPFEAIIERLIDLELLLQSNEDDRILSLHRLHRKRIRERLSAGHGMADQLLDRICALAEERGKATSECIENQDLRWELSPLSALARHLLGSRTNQGIRLSNSLSPSFRALAAFEQGKSLLEQALAFEEDNGVDLVEVAVSYSNLAMILRDQGDFTGAKISMERGIENEKKHFAPNHPTFAISYSNLAAIQKDLGDLAGARASIETAIEIGQKHLAPNHPALATNCSNLALIQLDQGDLVGARASMEQAIEIGQRHFHPDHSTLATMYSNLAVIQQDLADFAEARASIEKAIEIKRKHFAPDHPTFATMFSNLAMIRKDQGDLVGAKASMEKAIDIHGKHFAPDHPTFATMFSNLAVIQKRQGDLVGAKTSMEQAIEIGQKHFHPDHPAFATMFSNLACIEIESGRQSEACKLWQLALDILRKHFSDEHPSVQTVRGALNRHCIDDC